MSVRLPCVSSAERRLTTRRRRATPASIALVAAIIPIIANVRELNEEAVRIVNILEVRRRGAWVASAGSYKQLKLMQDADQIVAECSDRSQRTRSTPANARQSHRQGDCLGTSRLRCGRP